MSIIQELDKFIGIGLISKAYGKGKIISFSESDSNIFMSVLFYHNDDQQVKKFNVIISLEKGSIDFENDQVKNSILYLLEKFKNNLIISNKHDDIIRCVSSKNDDVNQLVTLVLNDRPFSIEMISKYGVYDFEEALFNEGFLMMHNVLKGRAIISKSIRAYILVMASYIALKYYDGDLHSKIFSLYIKYCGEESTNSIRNTYYKILGEYRVKYKYFDISSYNAVPIIACGFPKYRLKDLFIISYDIYKKKLLFDEDISDEQIEEKVHGVLCDLRNKELISDSDTIKRTEYYMPRYTQSSIYSGVCLDSLVKIITKSIRLIILHLTRAEDSFSVDDYFLDAYKWWVSYFNNNNKERGEYEKTRVLSKPFFTISRDLNVSIMTGKYCMDDSYDPNNVSIVVFENGEMQQTILLNEPNDIEYNDDIAMSGYIINRKKITLECNPVHNISYSIMCGEMEIFNSKDRMYRNALFFDGEGKEIKAGTKYDGEIFVITRCNNKEEYGDSIINLRQRNDYFISRIEINSVDIFSFDGEPYLFSRIKEPLNIGYRIPWSSFVSMENKEYLIYKYVTLLLEASCSKDDIFIKVDGIIITEENDHVSFYTSIFANNNGMYTYKVKVFGLESGFHIIEVFNGSTKRQINNAIFEFVLDKIENKKIIKRVNEGIFYSLQSDLLKEEKMLFFKNESSVVSIDAFSKGLGFGKINIFPSIISFSYDGIKWQRLSDSKILLCDCIDDKLYINGPKEMKFFCKVDNSTIKKQLNYTNNTIDNCKYILHVNYLKTLKNRKIISLIFEYGIINVEKTVWFTPYVRKEECSFNFDKETGFLYGMVLYEGLSQVFLLLSCEEEGTIYKEKILSSQEIKIDLNLLIEEPRYLSISLHLVNSNSLFDQYEKEPFFTFNKQLRVDIQGFQWIKNPNTPLYDSTTGLINLQYFFSGCSKIKVNISPTLSNDVPIESIELSSSEKKEIDLRGYFFNKYYIFVYKYSNKNMSFNSNPIFISERVLVSSSTDIKIKAFITDNNEERETVYVMAFQNFKIISGKQYACVELKSYYNCIENVYIATNGNYKNFQAFDIYRRVNGELSMLKLRNGKTIKSIVFSREKDHEKDKSN